jgi:hypothetical protein
MARMRRRLVVYIDEACSRRLNVIGSQDQGAGRGVKLSFLLGDHLGTIRPARE